MGSITKPSPDHELDVLVIGAGLSGIYSLYALRKHDPTLKVKIVEAGTDFGGVWYHNRYPGARVDSEWPLYQFSIPEVWKDWTYDDRFPDQNQIRAYIAHTVEVLDLRRDTIFNTVIDGVHWDDGKKRWISQTTKGATFTSRYLFICTGSSYKRHFPDFKGLSRFKGTLLHSSAFPEEGVDMTGKRVGVIGNGATGVQIIQELAKQDCQLINFIRTPNTAFPMVQRKISKEEEAKMKKEYESIFPRLRENSGGFLYKQSNTAFDDASEEQKKEICEHAWQQGGFAYLAASFTDYAINEKTNRYIYNFWAEKVRARVKDPKKRQIVAPIPQENYWATKRPSLETDYYESLDRPNVTLVNLKESPIQEITESGVLTADGHEHKLDILILATGYDAVTGSQIALNIHDRSGAPLGTKWRSGVETYLGMTIPGMPNVFMSYGPQAPTAFGNAPPFIEVQVDWMVAVLAQMQTQNIETIEPRPEVARKWARDNNEMSDLTFMSKEDSWWNGANIPGKKREALNYVGGFPMYIERINDALDGFKGFDVLKKGHEVPEHC